METLKQNPIIKSKYKGYEYRAVHNWAFPTMQWWCGYVRLPDDHRFVSKISKKVYFSWGKIEKITNKMSKRSGLKFPKVPKSMKHPRRFHFNYDAIDIDVHGGLTFAQVIKKKKDDKRFPQQFTRGWWIGWDYNHAGDNHDIVDEKTVPKNLRTEWASWQEKMKEINVSVYGVEGGAGEKYGMYDKHWTQEEVEADCRDVIDQLIAAQSWYYPIKKAYVDSKYWFYWKQWRFRNNFKKWRAAK